MIAELFGDDVRYLAARDGQIGYCALRFAHALLFHSRGSFASAHVRSMSPVSNMRSQCDGRGYVGGQS